jgi:hypothetical protein
MIPNTPRPVGINRILGKDPNGIPVAPGIGHGSGTRGTCHTPGIGPGHRELNVARMIGQESIACILRKQGHRADGHVISPGWGRDEEQDKNKPESFEHKIPLINRHRTGVLPAGQIPVVRGA